MRIHLPGENYLRQAEKLNADIFNIRNIRILRYREGYMTDVLNAKKKTGDRSSVFDAEKGT